MPRRRVGIGVTNRTVGNRRRQERRHCAACPTHRSAAIVASWVHPVVRAATWAKRIGLRANVGGRRRLNAAGQSSGRVEHDHHPEEPTGCHIHVHLCILRSLSRHSGGVVAASHAVPERSYPLANPCPISRYGATCAIWCQPGGNGARIVFCLADWTFVDICRHNIDLVFGCQLASKVTYRNGARFGCDHPQFVVHDSKAPANVGDRWPPRRCCRDVDWVPTAVVARYLPRIRAVSGHGPCIKYLPDKSLHCVFGVSEQKSTPFRYFAPYPIPSYICRHLEAYFSARNWESARIPWIRNVSAHSEWICSTFFLDMPRYGPDTGWIRRSMA